MSTYSMSNQNDDKEEYELCDKYERFVMETGEVVFFSSYTFMFLSLLAFKKPFVKDTVILKGLCDSPGILRESVTVPEIAKALVTEEFGEHNSIKEMIRNEVDNAVDEILCFLSFCDVRDLFLSEERFLARYEKFR